MKKISALVFVIIFLGLVVLYLFTKIENIRPSDLINRINNSILAINNIPDSNVNNNISDNNISTSGQLYADADLDKISKAPPTTISGNQYVITRISNGYHVEVLLNDFNETVNNTYLTRISFHNNDQIEELIDNNNDGGFGSPYNEISIHMNLGSEICTPQLQAIMLEFSNKDLAKINYKVSNFIYNSIIIENKGIAYHQWRPPEYAPCAPGSSCTTPKLELPEIIKQQCAKNELATLFPQYIYQQKNSHGIGPDKYYMFVTIHPFFYRPQSKELGIIKNISFDLIK